MDHNQQSLRTQAFLAQFDNEEEEEKVDPHSQAEIYKVYMKQQRASAPESFERLKEDYNDEQHSVSAKDQQQNKTLGDNSSQTNNNNEASSSYQLTYTSVQDFPSSQIEGQFRNIVAQALPNQSSQHRRASNYQQVNVLTGGAQRSAEMIESFRSPWLSQQRSSIPKSSFCLSMSLSGSSNQGTSGPRKKNRMKNAKNDRDDLPPREHRREHSHRDSEIQSSSRQIQRTNSDETDNSVSPRMVVLEDDKIEEHHPILTSQNDDDDSSRQSQTISQRKGGKINSKEKGFVEDLLSLSPGALQQSPDENDIGQHLLTSGLNSNQRITELAEKTDSPLDMADDHVNMMGLQSQNEYYREQIDDDGQRYLSPESKQTVSQNSAKIAQIRSMIEEHHAKTMSHPQGRTLKRTTTMTKPSNSPMLLASAASQSASSPASGGHLNGGADRLTERRLNFNNVESFDSISQPKLTDNNPMRSTSTVQILQHEKLQPFNPELKQNQSEAPQGHHADNNNEDDDEHHLIMKDDHAKDDAEQMSLEERQIFNNYAGTGKRLQFDNMSSCSLILSKSGASSSQITTAHAFGSKGRGQINRHSRDSVVSARGRQASQIGGKKGITATLFNNVSNKSGGSSMHKIIMRSFTSTNKEASNCGGNQSTSLNNDNVTLTNVQVAKSSSSFVGNQRQTTQTQHEAGSQVSGHGSLLHQFITEGIEEDTIDEECKMIGPLGGGVSVNPMSSSDSSQSSSRSHSEHSLLKVGSSMAGVQMSSKQNLLRGSESLAAANAIVVTSSSCIPLDSKMLLQSSVMPHDETDFANQLQKVPSTVLRGNSNPSDAINHSTLGLQRNQNSTINASNLNLNLNLNEDRSNQSIALQLNAIKTSEAHRRPVITPEIAMYRDDEIQRVVSQVRNMESASGEGTNQHYKFEIERTDSLEFTRNSVTGLGDDDESQRQGVLSSHHSSPQGADKTTLERDDKNLDTSQDDHQKDVADKFNQSSDDSDKDNCHQDQQLDQLQSPSDSLRSNANHHLQLQSSSKSNSLQVFKSKHSLTSEQHEQHLKRDVKVDKIEESSDDEPPYQDLNERSATSSQYNSDSAVLQQDGSKTNSQFRDMYQQRELTSGDYYSEFRQTASYNNPSFNPYQLPHANSKVFDEGDFPIPAKFHKKSSCLQSQKPSKRVSHKVSTVSAESEAELEFKKSRVRDHVNKFIRQSQDLGTSLGLINDQTSIERQTFKGRQPQVSYSVKQSMLLKPQQYLSPQRVMSFNRDNLSPAKQSQIELLSAINRIDNHNNLPSSVHSRGTMNNNELPEYEIYSNNNNVKSYGAVTSYKDSHFHKQGAQDHQSLNQHRLVMQRDALGKMSYEELAGSQLLLDSEADQNQNTNDYYQNMPQTSIAYVAPPSEPQQCVSNQEAYIKYSQDNKHRMHAGSTFEQVIQEFNRQNYFQQVQSPDSRSDDQGSESTNFGQLPNQYGYGGPIQDLKLASVAQSSLTDEQCNYYHASEYIPKNQNQNQIHHYNQQKSQQVIKLGKVPDNLQVLDQSAAEYDCADEAMDGSDSICIDDIILEQNRERVQAMTIQKPVLTPSLENKKSGKNDSQGNRQQANQSKQKTSVLSSLLFAGKNSDHQKQQQNQQPRRAGVFGVNSVLQTTRNSNRNSFLQKGDDKVQMQRNNSVTSNQQHRQGKLSLIDNTTSYLTREKKKVMSNKKCLPLLDDNIIPESVTVQPQAYPQQNATPKKIESQPQSSRWRTEASPHSEYQISKGLMHKQHQQQAVVNQHIDQFSSAPSLEQVATNTKGNPPMSTIMESLISIDNQHEVIPLKGQQKMMVMAQQRQIQNSNSGNTNCNTNVVWPSSIKKEKGKSRLYYHPQPPNTAANAPITDSQSQGAYMFTDRKQPIQMNSARYDYDYDQNTAGAGNRQQYNTANGTHQYYKNSSSAATAQDKTQQKHFNRTVLSLNSSRQPTTKNQLESHFMQRSQSNGSSQATRKPDELSPNNNNHNNHRAVNLGGFTTEREYTQRRFDERQSLINEGRFHGTQIRQSSMTPRRTNLTKSIKHIGGATPQQYLVQNPMTGETAEHIHEMLDIEGRGFTDSQQFSLDSDMNHLFGFQQANNVQDETSSLLPLMQQQTSLMFRTEHNLENMTEGMQPPLTQHTDFNIMQSAENLHQHNNQHLDQQQNTLCHDCTTQQQYATQSVTPGTKSGGGVRRSNLMGGYGVGAQGNAIQTTTKKQHKTTLTNLTAQSSLLIQGGNGISNNGSPNNQTTDCRQCSSIVLGQKKHSQTSSAFQNAIKMTKYLMSEIERLQKTNTEAAGVVSEHQMAEMLRQNFSEFDQQESGDQQQKHMKSSRNINDSD